ncbi:MAG: ergothioneine biosynthesis protein EgtB [Planctomycetota bacterium]|nr:MAG: ergothioneine biosynthesis protein EgtB [Planctomycetota bacterium]
MERAINRSEELARLAECAGDARRRTVELVWDLDDGQFLGPLLPIVNPPLWEVAHVAWFQERWMLRRRGERSLAGANADALYDSAEVHHGARWSIPLLPRAAVLDYLQAVHEKVADRLRAGDLGEEDVYFLQLATYHEDMHAEAFTYTRQTLGYPAPRLSGSGSPPAGNGTAPCAWSDDVEIAGGVYTLGSRPQQGFLFDNEKWAHPVEVEPFRMARCPVSQADFAAFADAGGYQRRAFWSAEGWAWRERACAHQPVYWRRGAAGRWERRHFDAWVPLEPALPAVHVNWHEAEAWCRWAGRRLPSEAEWEVAASGSPASAAVKHRYPWGEEARPELAHTDWKALGCAPVTALQESASGFGCRQMIGNVWEWTASDFAPYPGFSADPYAAYSRPWFGTHKVLRGGSWATTGRLARNAFRNFYRPERRDIFAGFRSCAPR